MAYMGTIVVQGHGKAIITATGTDTQVGHISKMLDTTPVQTTPLQKKLGKPVVYWARCFSNLFSYFYNRSIATHTCVLLCL